MESATERRMCRLIRLLQYLSETDGANATILAGILNVSTRTIFRDIRLLRHVDLPLVYDEQRQVYTMHSRGAIIPRRLGIEDLIAIAVLIKSADETVSDAFHLDDVWGKLVRSVPPHYHSVVHKVWERLSVRKGGGAEEAETRQPVVTEKLTSLLLATAEERKVRIAYHDGGAGLQRTLISPYTMVADESEWWLVGRSSVHRRVVAICLRQIEQTERVDEDVSVPPRFRNGFRREDLHKYAV